MDKLNKHLYTTICSIFLLGLTSCTNSANKVPTNNKNIENKIYSKTRTISKDDKIKIIDTNSSYSYDYNLGISTYSPVGIIPENEENTSNVISENNNQNEQIFTIQDVEQITNDLTNEYTSYIQENSNQYEDYINQLNKNYNTLENEYNLLLDDISNLNNNLPEQNSIIETNSEGNKPEEKIIPRTREEEIDLIYQKAIEIASKNLDTFEPIQGQKPKNEINNNNLNNKGEISDDLKLTADNIYKSIKNNLILPEHSIKDLTFLSNTYNISSNEVLDFKLLSNISSNTQNPFEILIIKTSELSENDLTNKISSRIDSILNTIPENNININDKILLVDLNEYVIFCISDINKDILNSLQSL